MTWREIIKTTGGTKIAKQMGVKYPTIYKYFKPGSICLPREKMKDLCLVMRNNLTMRDYKKFYKSLTDEMAGNVN